MNVVDGGLDLPIPLQDSQLPRDEEDRVQDTHVMPEALRVTGM